jgi:hypothetical protein
LIPAPGAFEKGSTRTWDMTIRFLSAGMMALAISFASLAGAQGRLNPHDEAAQLIDALELSTAQRNAARDYVILQMAHGGSPRPALQQWLQMQAGRGVAIRCKATAADCIAGR